MKHEDITTLAHLARIHVDDSMVEDLTDNLHGILALIDQLRQVDTADSEPLSHPLDATQRLRTDDITENNQRDALQSNAPALESGLFLVPQVIE